ncbi:MAG: hypothetical protein AB4080_08070 [Trichodesmium sp.]
MIGRFYSDRSDRSSRQKSHLVKHPEKKVSGRKNFAKDVQIGKSAFCEAPKKIGAERIYLLRRPKNHGIV